MIRLIFKWAFRILLLSFIIIQFITIDRSVPRLDPKQDFIYLMNPPTEVGNSIKMACYDCHSYKTEYPWYSYIAPVSWWIGHHIEEGREHLNFSIWGKYNDKKSLHKLEEIIEEAEEREMPLNSYIIMHGSAELNKEQITALTKWLNSINKAEKE